MKLSKPILGAVLGAVLSISPRAFGLDGILISNESVPVGEIPAAMVKNIYAGKTMYWEGGQAIVLVIAGNSTDGAIQEVSGMSPTQFRTHWQRLGFSGRGQPPKKADDVAKAIALVKSTKGAVAIVPAGSDVKGVKILPVK